MVSVSPGESGFTLHFADGRQATAELVIIADGSMSKARALLTDQVPRLMGTYAIQGEIYQPQLTCPAIYQLLNRGNVACIANK